MLPPVTVMVCSLDLALPLSDRLTAGLLLLSAVQKGIATSTSSGIRKCRKIRFLRISSGRVSSLCASLVCPIADKSSRKRIVECHPEYFVSIVSFVSTGL